MERNREILTEAYNIYQIYKQEEIGITALQAFLENFYGNYDKKFYEVYLYETVDHNQAVEVENMLKFRYKNSFKLNFLQFILKT